MILKFSYFEVRYDALIFCYSFQAEYTQIINQIVIIIIYYYYY
jgi:hypothetical protein